jgi:hypoxanthine phosphoribosyltransferase
MADLLRHLTIPIECDFIRLSSYGKASESSGRIKVIMPVRTPIFSGGGDIASLIKGRDIIIVDDIIDTGLTARFLVDRLKQAQARSVKLCALLDKPSGRPANRGNPARRIAPVKIDYPGFKIPNKFVVGYGLDYKERYRQLKYLGYLSQYRKV